MLKNKTNFYNCYITIREERDSIKSSITTKKSDYFKIRLLF